ncbi:TetR/AcrR family transcriptional regulator [Clostridium tetanomorphum]|uniref:TetR/AcrR family transcriptional regulator n=1 Tax=Clostridium tetanomorphum TaxID=1553 RepID=A0A923E846_CLOTT|nr:TetR/AcrR family transcriptional regulator [Clostridium tetanomorphum]MBC2396997.1 TetR/AcrR family transcriptional regulator [Clostridium tetanomorphum]NRZ99161.1 AcrR family transcriptional regulator [Clostridium tetanomorphum]
MYTKQKIMNSAFHLFAQKGSDFSLNEVAEEVEIKKPSIYAHFQSKEELLHKVIDREIDTYFLKINDEMDSFCKNEDNIEKILKKTFMTILHYYDSLDRLYFWKRIILLPPKGFEVELIEKSKELFNQRYNLVKNLLLKAMEENIIRKQCIETIALSYFSTIHGILASVIIYKEKDLTHYYDSIWENFWRGMK